MLDIAQKQRSIALKAEARPNQWNSDELYRNKQIGELFPLIHQKEWMMQAMWNVLHNQGARTAGVDGIVKADYW